jgi:uncharacterized phosphosugar-binding protein
LRNGQNQDPSSVLKKAGFILWSQNIHKERDKNMLVERYFQALHENLERVAAQEDAILHAAHICADSIQKGGVVHIFDSGHLVSQELVHRAGGWVGLSALTFSLAVNNPVRTREDRPNPSELSYAYISHIFLSNQLREGDVLFIGSVSGKTANVVELALQARAHGLTVVAVTATAYSSKLASEHPSGKRLFEAADLVLNNGAPYGDAMLEVEGLDYPVCPASGIGAAAVMWAVVAGLVEELLARGMQPTVYPSVNRPDGWKLVSQVEAKAKEKGY